MKSHSSVIDPSVSAGFAGSNASTGQSLRRWAGIGAALALGLAGYGCSKPAPEAAATPTPTPAPTALPTAAATVAPTATPVDTPKYTGAQQMEYIKTAQDAFVGIRAEKNAPFLEANKAYADAGGASAKGLTSKDAIAQRRALIEKVRQANDDALSFVSTQENVYRDELSKTPLLKADVDSLVEQFVGYGKQKEIVKLRETDRDLLKTGDEMMAFLDKKFGAWTISGDRPVFKKQADATAYSELGKKYNGYVTQLQALQTDINAPLPTPGSSPISSASPTPTTAVAATPGTSTPAASPMP